MASLLVAQSLPAQAPTPTPPPRLDQDALDFRGRSSLTGGSGARALGMGGAFLARADDATAASWNPAGLSYLRLPELSVVFVGSALDTVHREIDLAIARDETGTSIAPDFIALTIPYERGVVSGAAQLSFQRAFSFDGNRDIADCRALRPQGCRSLAQAEDFVRSSIDGSGGFDLFALATGVRLAHRLRIGASLNRWTHGYTQTRSRRLFNPSVQHTQFELSGWNANLGVIWSPLDNLNLGVVGKTPFTAGVDLWRARTDLVETEGQGEPRAFTNGFRGDDVRLKLPGAVGTGVSWRPRSNLMFSADYTRTFWSEARIYDFFVVSVRSEAEPRRFESLRYPELEAREQRDTEEMRFGTEYVFVGQRFSWPIRAGYFLDRQHFLAADDKAPHFWGFSAGAGILRGPILFDVAYVRETGRYPAANAGSIKVALDRLYASVIYRYPRRP